MPLFTSPGRKAFIAFGFASESFNFKQEKTIESDKNDIPQRQCAKDGVMPKFPFSMMLSGSSGSGKTVLLTNLIFDVYKHCFQEYIVPHHQ